MNKLREGARMYLSHVLLRKLYVSGCAAALRIQNTYTHMWSLRTFPIYAQGTCNSGRVE